MQKIIDSLQAWASSHPQVSRIVLLNISPSTFAPPPGRNIEVQIELAANSNLNPFEIGQWNGELRQACETSIDVTILPSGKTIDTSKRSDFVVAYPKN